MKLDQSFINLHLLPATEKHKEYVKSIYPNAYFQSGIIYEGDMCLALTDSRWDISGAEAEYYAWMWAYQHIQEEMLRKLEQ